MAEPTTGTATRRRYTGWKVVGANSVVWSLQSMVWVQGFGNLAVELRDQPLSVGRDLDLDLCTNQTVSRVLRLQPAS